MALFKAAASPVTPAQSRTGCEACTLSSQWSKLHHAKIQPKGNRNPYFYFLGVQPDATDDEFGEPFAGAAGQYLRRELRHFDNDQIPYRTGLTIRCRPPGDREAKPAEVAACWKGHGTGDLVSSAPKVIVAFGVVALNHFVEGGIHEWQGVRIPVRLDNGECAWLFPLHHPSYFLNDNIDGDHLTIWKRNLARLRKEAFNWPAPSVPSRETILAGITPLSIAEVSSVQGLFPAQSELAIDLETNGLMPWEHDARILSASVSNDKETFAWLIDHPENPNVESGLELLQETLSSALRLIAQNAIFEQRWLAAAFGLLVFGWKWCDTMARQFAQYGMRLQRLEQQTLLHYGFDVKAISNVDPVKWRSTPVKDLLVYNGLDSKWTHKIWNEALPEWAAVEVVRQGEATAAFAAISWRGMLVDNTELGVQSRSLERAILTDTQKITQDPEVISWEIANAAKFNPASPDQVARYFGLESADEEALRDVDEPLARSVLRLRKLDKLLTTYMKGIQKATYSDGMLHPDYSTMRTVTGRSSSSKPNSQNMPKRENKEVRKVVVAPPGQALVSFDYKQLEAMCVGMHAGDSTLLEYLWGGIDIHREWAVELFDNYGEIADRLCPHVKDEKIIIARVRGEIKNGFVFPLIYGAGVPKCSGQLQTPAAIVKQMEEKFFTKYHGIKKWQKEMHEFYDEHFYVETLTRRRRFGPVSWTEQLNTPIQGVGSDIVVDASVRCLELAVENNDVHFVPMANIHDDLSFYLPISGMEKYIETIARIMVTPRYSWITVPLSVEVHVGRLNWSDQDEFRTYKTGDFYPLPKTGLAQQIRALQSIARRNPRDAFTAATSWGSEQPRASGTISLNSKRRIIAASGEAYNLSDAGCGLTAANGAIRNPPPVAGGANAARRERLALKPVGRTALARTATP